MLRRFWQRPRGARWRAWAFQLHLWCGLIIGLWALVMGLSGSLLVFKDEIEAALEPELFTVEPEAGRASLDSVADYVRRRFPRHLILQFRDLDQTHRSHIVRVARRDGNKELIDQRHIHYNPYTGKILGEYKRWTGWVGWFQELHYFLFAGHRGLVVNGSLGGVLLLMCLTGLVVWWPGRRNWKAGLEIKWSAGWRRLNFDLHRAGGFFSAALLAIMAFTGFYFAHSRIVTVLLVKATGGDPEQVQLLFTSPKSEIVEGGRWHPLDTIRENADSLLPEGFVLSVLRVPLTPDDSFALFGRRPGNPLSRGLGIAYVDQYSGRVLAKFDSREQSPGMRAVLACSPIHFGTWGGAWSKALWVLVGLTPGALFVTGFLMWWSRVLSKRWKKLGKASASGGLEGSPAVGSPEDELIQR